MCLKDVEFNDKFEANEKVFKKSAKKN